MMFLSAACGVVLGARVVSEYGEVISWAVPAT